MSFKFVFSSTAIVLMVMAIRDVKSATVYYTETITGVGSIDTSGNNRHQYVTDSNYIYSGVATDSAHGKVYWTRSGVRGSGLLIGAVFQANSDGSNIQQIDTDDFSASSEQSSPRGIAVDSVGGKIYWADATDFGHSGVIYRANLDGSGKTSILNFSYPDQMALDVRDGLIYWNNYVGGQIDVANLNGSNEHALISGLTHVYGLALDVPNNKLYYNFTDSGGNRSIASANLNGTNSTTLLSGLGDVREMAIDPVGGKLYWTDLTNGLIQDCNLNGTNLQTLVSGLNEPFGIAITQPVPEPSTFMLAGIGAAVLLAWRVRSRETTNCQKMPVAKFLLSAHMYT